MSNQLESKRASKVEAAPITPAEMAKGVYQVSLSKEIMVLALVSVLATAAVKPARATPHNCVMLDPSGVTTFATT